MAAWISLHEDLPHFCSAICNVVFLFFLIPNCCLFAVSWAARDKLCLHRIFDWSLFANFCCRPCRNWSFFFFFFFLLRFLSLKMQAKIDSSVPSMKGNNRTILFTQFSYFTGASMSVCKWCLFLLKIIAAKNKNKNNNSWIKRKILWAKKNQQNKTQSVLECFILLRYCPNYLQNFGYLKTFFPTFSRNLFLSSVPCLTLPSKLTSSIFPKIKYYVSSNFTHLVLSKFPEGIGIQSSNLISFLVIGLNTGNQGVGGLLMYLSACLTSTFLWVWTPVRLLHSLSN